jgi:hypothetical protein
MRKADRDPCLFAKDKQEQTQVDQQNPFSQGVLLLFRHQFLRSSILIDCQSAGSKMGESPGEHPSESSRRMSFPQPIPSTADRCNVVQVTIDMVPEVALIEVFHFYMAEALAYDPFRHNREAWVILAHVCRKWRDIVFGSPRRLNARLYFRGRKSVRAMLDTWPPFLIDIWGSDFRGRDAGNIVEALEHKDRIHKVELWDSSIPQMEQVLAAMQKSFPSLTELAVDFYTEMGSLVLPDLLLGESAPLLRSLRLRSVQFPLSVLRNLLRSADLVQIRIWKIPEAGFISPEDVVACLSGLARLEEFELGFQSALDWASRDPPSSARCVLPALTSLLFKGSRKYLEHLVALIDSPLLDNLDVIIFHQPVWDTPQLAQFVDRTSKLKAPREAHIFLDGSDVFITLPWTPRRGLHFRMANILSDQFAVMVQLCTLSFLRTLIPTIKHLYILESGTWSLYWLRNVESSQWLDFLRPFLALENLYLSQRFSRDIVPALDGSDGIGGEGMTELLPCLQNISLERPSSLSHPGPVDEAIEQPVTTALNVAGRPIAASQWTRVHHPWWGRIGDR